MRPAYERRSDLDWLRVVGILTVFVVHVAQVFSPWQSWHIQNEERGALFGQINVLAFPWLMPLFMMLAGIGSWLSLGHRSNRQYAKDRTLRLLVPFVIGTLLLIPPQLYVERLAQGRFNGSYWEFYPHFFECCYPEGNLAAGHLWFLAYLWLYSMVALPMLRFIRGAEGKHLRDRLVKVFSGRAGMFLGIVPLALTQAGLRGAYPQSLNLISDWANHGMLFLLYITGLLLASEPGLLKVIDEKWRSAILPAAIGSLWLAVYVANSRVPGILPRAGTGIYFIFWAVFSMAGWCWILVLLGFTREFLGQPPSWVEYLSRKVSPFYMLHQTIIVLVAFFIVQLPAALAWKVLILFVTALTATLALTHVLGRWRVTRLAFGGVRP
jgi:fucose 4-O-acetylase-like acetyltransferase